MQESTLSGGESAGVFQVHSTQSFHKPAVPGKQVQHMLWLSLRCLHGTCELSCVDAGVPAATAALSYCVSDRMPSAKQTQVRCEGQAVWGVGQVTFVPTGMVPWWSSSTGANTAT